MYIYIYNKYNSCFDPLLQILHNTLITRKIEELEYENSSVNNYKYVKEINFDQINYAFECIIALITGLSQTYVKRLWKTPIKCESLLSKWNYLSKGSPHFILYYLSIINIIINPSSLCYNK